MYNCFYLILIIIRINFYLGYADRIQELNSMPVRSDTLRVRKRKMEIEEELKKIDEGIKVFQRPKVFVKINA